VRRQLVAGLVAGATVGFLLGLGGRLAMRIIAVAAGIDARATLGGSLEVVLTGLAFGIPAGIVFALLRHRGLLTGRGCGALFGAGGFAVVGVLPPPAARSALADVGHPGLSALLFGVLFVAAGWLLERLLGGRADSGVMAERPATAAAAVVEKVNLAEMFSRFDAHWDPKIVGELNGQLVKLVKFRGEFIWHHHDTQDELFLVVKGRFQMELRDRSIKLGEGEFLIIPRGVEHRPVAEQEVEVLLFEPIDTRNTGNVETKLTRYTLERL
jgi:mannose-6-phosphate isomerase-like protein (cupin superfamily)